MKRIYLSPPYLSGNELKYVKGAMKANWIAPVGPDIDAFEQLISDYFNNVHVVALSSGTAAIHLALKILDVNQGDEVICSTFTFAGSCFPIRYQGATPVFIESESQTWNMDPGFLEDAIKDGIKRNKKPKAIILVHLYGVPAKLDEILKVANKYEIPIIEDAAEALGAT
ncbi:MAG: DegT/DnrJ/EryC1/StrS aminotransferase family protein, partial [Fulvivirga sp.]|nr:DegT/DnrJ/EryC1/StrS aminotransferase family protein [Fulvivirga sp.]